MQLRSDENSHLHDLYSSQKGIPHTGVGGPKGYNRLRYSYFRQSGYKAFEAVNPTRQSPLPPGKFLILISVGG